MIRRMLVSIAACLLATPATARFLQTDPMGYGPDPNLYVYVANDPMDNTDPSGMTCTGMGVSLSCQIDRLPSTAGMTLGQRAELQKKVSAFNRRYTDTVKKLLSGHHSADVTLPKLSGNNVRQDTVSATFSASEVANSLIARIVVYAPGESNAHTDTRANTTFIPSSVLVGNASPTYGNMPPSERGSNVILVHEGMHGTETERDLVRRAGGTEDDLGKNGPLGPAHQEPYDNAAQGLYDPAP